MNQRITPEQLSELTDEQRKRLQEWWKPQMYDVYLNDLGDLGDGIEWYVHVIDRESFVPGDDSLPLLSIGQMIEFLGEHNDRLYIEKYNHDYAIFNLYSAIELGGSISDSVELCDALWEAVKRMI